MSSNHGGITNNKSDIRDFFKSSEKKRKYDELEENSFNISTQPNKKMSREPLFELQPTYEIPSPEKIENVENMPKLEKSELCSKIEKLINDSDDSSIPDLEPAVNEPIKPKLTAKIGPKSKTSNCKKRRKYFTGMKNETNFDFLKL